MNKFTLPKTERNSTIEYLKLLLMLGVIILHICGGSSGAIALGGGFDLQLLRSFFSCAVDCFIMISGYYLCLTCKRSIQKVLNLYAIAVLFALLLNVIGSILDSDFSILRLLKTFAVGNYFLLLYSAVYILSPYINKVFDNINS